MPMATRASNLTQLVVLEPIRLYLLLTISQSMRASASRAWETLVTDT
jgi:hypothetical protein